METVERMGRRSDSDCFRNGGSKELREGYIPADVAALRIMKRGIRLIAFADELDTAKVTYHPPHPPPRPHISSFLTPFIVCAAAVLSATTAHCGWTMCASSTGGPWWMAVACPTGVRN